MTAWVTKATGCMGPNVYPQVPDGGWGWAVAVAFFFVEVFTYGVIKSFGIFLQDLMSHFGESNSRVSWIISICVFIMTFTAPLSSLMSNRFGFRPVVMLGGLLVSLGTITTAFARSIDEMYVTVGVISGLGYCLTFLPTVTILSQYFCRHRSLVTAVASTGESFAMFAFAPAFTALKDRIGWRYCLIVVGVLQASIVFWGALLRPIVIRLKSTEDSGPSPTQLETKYAEENEHTRTSISSEDSGVQSLSTSWINLAGEQGGGQNCSTVEEETPLQETVNQPPLPTRPSILNFSLLRDSSFICYALFGLFATLGFFAPQLYVIELSVSRGVDRDRAAYMLSTMAVAEIFGRLSIGWVLNRRPIRKIYILLICVTLLCLVLVAFYFAMDFWGLSVCCVMYGFLLGTVASTHIPMLAEDDVVGIDRMPSAVGIYVFIQSFAGLAGPPLGGFLVDKSHNYGSAFYSCAVGMGLGALFLGFVLPAKRGLCRERRKSSQRQEDAVAPSETDSSQGREDIPVEFMEVDLAMDTSPTQSRLVQSTV